MKGGLGRVPCEGDGGWRALIQWMVWTAKPAAAHICDKLVGREQELALVQVETSMKQPQTKKNKKCTFRVPLIFSMAYWSCRLQIPQMPLWCIKKNLLPSKKSSIGRNAEYFRWNHSMSHVFIYFKQTEFKKSSIGVISPLCGGRWKSYGLALNVGRLHKKHPKCQKNKIIL